MKHFKVFDCIVSVSLLAWMAGYWFTGDGVVLLVCLFFTGSWHIISMVVHFFSKYTLSAVRNFYHWFTLPAIPLMLSIIHPLLTIAGPVMATFYTILCLVETFNLFRREN